MLIESLLENTRSHANEIAIIDDSGQHTFAQVAALAAGVAKALAGKTNRQNVAILLPPGIGYVASFYGILLAGKTVVPVNFLLGAREIGHILKDSGVDLVISANALIERLATAMPGAGDIMAAAAAAGLQLMDIGEIPPANPAEISPVARGANDTAVLMYTSGTVGLPKGVILTYENIQYDVDAAIKHAALTHNHKFLGIVPLFHSFGMTAMMVAPMQLAATVVYLQRFSPAGCLDAIRKHGVSLLFGVPSMFTAIARLKHIAADDFKNIYAMITGAEPQPATLREL